MTTAAEPDTPQAAAFDRLAEPVLDAIFQRAAVAKTSDVPDDWS